MVRLRVALCVALCWALLLGARGSGDERDASSGEVEWPLHMPQARGKTLRHNDYMCRASKLPSASHYIVTYEPRADPTVAHHMLVFGCAALRPGTGDSSSWTCKSSTICSQYESPQIIYAWALNASGFQLPPDVGQKVGGSSGINYVVLQIHYGEPEAVSQPSGEDPLALVLHMTQQRQRFVSGVYLLGAGSSIHPGRDTVNVDIACLFRGPKSITPIAFRTHAHSLSTVIVGYTGDGENWEEIGYRSPQDPQAFYPVHHDVVVEPEDWLAARCVYNTSEKDHTVHMGPNSEDEMCNFYIMYYTANDGHSLTEQDCWNPAPSYIHYPPTPTLPPSNHHHHHGSPMGEEDTPVSPVANTSNGTHHTPSLPLPSSLPNSQADVSTPANSSQPSEEEEEEKESGKENEEEEEEEDYVCPSSVPPNPSPTMCPSSTPTPPKPSESTGREGEGEGVEGEEETPSSEPSWFPDAGYSGNGSEGGAWLVPAEDWPYNDMIYPAVGDGGELVLGQVSSVVVDTDGSVLVLHRGSRQWTYDSFTLDNIFAHSDQGPIRMPTLLKFSSDGDLLQVWGTNIFYLPHSLSLDSKGNLWITDVAMHQVFKFPGVGVSSPSLTLGHLLSPGSDAGYFCKPAAVAVESSGVFYVADGYCNSRIIQYSSNGYIKQVWSYPIEGTSLLVPHSLALSPNEDTLYVADRENQRIISYATSGGGVAVFSKDEELGRVFGIALSGQGWPMYTINIPEEEGKAPYGLIVDSDGEVVKIWGKSEGFSRPHDLAVDSLGKAVYVAELNPPRIWKFAHITNTPTHKVNGEHGSTKPQAPATPAGPIDHPTINTPNATDTSDALSLPTSGTMDTSATQSLNISLATDPTQSTSDSTSSTTQLHNTTQQPDTEATESSVETETPTPTGPTNLDNSISPEPSSDFPTFSVHLWSTTSSPPLKVETESDARPSKAKHKVSTPTYHYGLFAAIFAVVVLILVVVLGILKEHRFCRFGLKKLSQKAKQTKQHPRDALHSLLGPSQLGFSRLRTYDSDSEVEEFPIFSRP